MIRFPYLGLMLVPLTTFLMPSKAYAFPFAKSCSSMQSYFNAFGKRAPLKANFQKFEHSDIFITENWVERRGGYQETVARCKDGFITEHTPQGTQICRGDIEYGMVIDGIKYGTTGWSAGWGKCVRK